MTITGTNSAGTSSTTVTVTVWTVTVMSNPIMSDWADLEVQGAQRLRARVGSAAGV